MDPADGNWIDLLAAPAGDIDVERLGRCDRPPTDYRGDWRACTGEFLDCAPPLGVFVDGCGCGCGMPSYEVPFESPAPDEQVPGDCPGPSGAFALLESEFDRLVIGVDSLFLISASAALRSDEGRIAWAWQVDKLTARLRLVPLADVVAAPSSYVADSNRGGGYGADADAYFRLDDYLMRASSAAESSRILPLPDADDQCSTFVVAGSEFYASSSAGSLWRAPLEPSTSQPTLEEQRGAYDDDDYSPLLGIDAQAVYWQAARGFSERVDAERLTLFRNCRM